jgi:multidrug efflux system outer membrane protein
MLALMGTGGCSMQPEYRVPEQEMPASFTTAAAEQAAVLPADAPAARTRWWRHFGSPELNALVDEALTHNNDLRAAVHRITQSRAALGASGAPLLPTLGLGFRSEREYPSSGRSTARPLLQQGTTHELTLDTSYELDLWGKNRSAVDAAAAQAEASVYDRETVVMTLTADVALAYFQYLQARDRTAVAESNVANMAKSLETVTQRWRIGAGTELEVAQQRDALAQAEAVVPTYRLDAERSRNGLALLVGRPPQALKLAGGSLNGLEIPRIAPGLPSDLLLQRPDVRRAEATLRAANANIGVARARLLPTLSLTGEVGYGTPLVASLMRPESFIWATAAQLVASIFDNGRAANDIAGSEARFAEMAENYRRSILASLRDTEDALAAMRLMAEKADAQERAVQRARETLRLARASFDIGMVDYLNVLDAERGLNRVLDERVLTRFARLEAAVSLYKALGGGTMAEQEQGHAATR